MDFIFDEAVPDAIFVLEFLSQGLLEWTKNHQKIVTFWILKMSDSKLLYLLFVHISNVSFDKIYYMNLEILRFFIRNSFLLCVRELAEFPLLRPGNTGASEWDVPPNIAAIGGGERRAA